MKIHKKRLDSNAKERRRHNWKWLTKMPILTPKDIGEDQLSFFTPARYKLYVKCLQESRNSNRFTRKPMPDAVREEFTRRSKEYQAYKLCEQSLLEQEANLNFKTQAKAFEATFFLPDYLVDEAWS